MASLPRSVMRAETLIKVLYISLQLTHLVFGSLTQLFLLFLIHFLSDLLSNLHHHSLAYSH